MKRYRPKFQRTKTKKMPNLTRNQIRNKTFLKVLKLSKLIPYIQLASNQVYNNLNNNYIKEKRKI